MKTKLEVKKMKRQLSKAITYMSLVVGSVMLSASPAKAAQELMLSGKEKLKAQVSSSKINRITFGSGHFSRIVGDSSKYHVIVDELGANLFLTSKVPVGSSFEISIINAAGLVADLVLDVKNIPGQIIKIHDEPAYEANASSKDAEGQEIANMLKSMISENLDKYYVKTVNRPLKVNNLSLDSNTLIIQDRTYRYGDLTGARLQVKSLKNDRKHVTELKEEDFKHVFEAVKAVSISNQHLARNKPSYVWIITKNEKVR